MGSKKKGKRKKEREKENGTILWAIILLIIPIIVYLTVFGGNGLSTKVNDWSLFGGFLAGVYTLAIGAANLYFLIYLSKKVQKIDDRRNRQNKIDAVVPYGFIGVDRWPRGFSIYLKNSGIGPLVINHLSIYNDELEFKNYYEVIFKDERLVNLRFDAYECAHFGNDLKALSPNESLTLFRVELNNPHVRTYVDNIINEYELKVVYTDIYSSSETEIKI